MMKFREIKKRSAEQKIVSLPIFLFIICVETFCASRKDKLKTKLFFYGKRVGETSYI